MEMLDVLRKVLIAGYVLRWLLGGRSIDGVTRHVIRIDRVNHNDPTG